MFVASIFAILVVSAASALAGVAPTYPPVVTVTPTPPATTPAVVATTPAAVATTPAGVAPTTVVPSGTATSPDTGVLGTSTSVPTSGATSSPDTAVLGTKVGNNAANNASGGLPHTGFEAGLLWSAVALLVIGLALLIVSRRRRQA
jgi:LPXTG-motif cell wall-anchored protein